MKGRCVKSVNKRGNGMNDREDKSRGIVTLMTETLDQPNRTLEISQTISSNETELSQLLW